MRLFFVLSAGLVIAGLLMAARRTIGYAMTPPKADTLCLAYEPDTVVLAGRLERADTSYYLRPSQALCVTRNETRVNAPVTDVRLVELVLTPSDYDQLAPRLGHHVLMRGTLSRNVAGQPRATLRLRVDTR